MVQIFVVVFGVLNYIYVEVIWIQSLLDWIFSYVCVFDFFGGVFVMIVFDNLKLVVIKVCFYDLVINCIYGDMVVYYDIVVVFVWLRKFKDKVKVEIVV